MLKKLLAGLTVFALSLGMVALTAAPASAHQGSIEASVVCNAQTGNYDVTYKLSWSAVPADTYANLYTRTGSTTFQNGWNLNTWNDWTDRGDSTGAAGFITWTESLPGTTTGNGPWVYAYTEWANGYNGSTHHDTRIEGLDGKCGDTTDKKVDICHYDNGQGGKWTSNNVSVSSIINVPNGHQYDADDIIPPFNYVKQGVNSSFPGLNWDAHGQWVYNNGCSDDVTPTKPVIAQAVCTAEGQVGGAKYVIPTFLAGGVSAGYYEWAPSSNGPWTLAAVGDHPVADGTSVWVRAVANSGYDLAGNDSNYVWKLDFTDVDASKCVTPAAPTPTYQICTGPDTRNQAKYTVPSDNGIQYQRWNGTTWVNIAAGDVNVNAFPTTIQLGAVAKPGFTLVGSPTSWTFQFTSAGPCLVDATPAAPTFKDALCVPTGPGTTAGYYVINAADHVVYEVRINGGSWNVVNPNTYGTHVNTSPGDVVEVRVSAAAGYTLIGANQGPWSHTFANPGDCLDDATPVDATFTDALCVEPGTGTTGGYYVVNGALGDHVIYEVQINGGGYNVVDPATYGTHVPTMPGDKVEIRASAAAGFKLVGNAQGPWSHTFADPGDCLDKAAAGDPIFVNEVCAADDTGVDEGYYTVVEGDHVSYEESFDSTNGVDGTWTPVDPSTYGDKIPTSPGDHVWVRAVADSGYKLADGATHIWDHVFLAAEDCLDDTPVKPAIVVNKTCVDGDSGEHSFTSGSITPPSGTPHVTYYVGPVDGLFVDAVPLTMETPFEPGDYKVWALADEGYQLVGEGGYVVNDPNARVIKDGQLAYEIVTVGFENFCTLPAVTPVVTFVQTTCSVAGSYTLAVDEPGLGAGVVWTVTGGLPNTLGKHSVASPGNVTITAVPAAGYGFTTQPAPPVIDGLPTLTWNYQFAGLPEDCLPTLAFTGGSVSSGALGLSALLTLGGILLIATRRREKADLSA